MKQSLSREQSRLLHNWIEVRAEELKKMSLYDIVQAVNADITSARFPYSPTHVKSALKARGIILPTANVDADGVHYLARELAQILDEVGSRQRADAVLARFGLTRSDTSQDNTPQTKGVDTPKMAVSV